MSLKLAKDIADVCPQTHSTKYRYRQITATRNITGANFPVGQINFRWTTSGNEKAFLSKSFLRIRHKLTRADGTTQLYVSDSIGWNMNPVSNIFQRCEFRMNSKVVQKIDNFMPQIDALKTRLNKSKAWLDSVGNATNSWEAKLNNRIQKVSSNGTVNNYTELGFLDLGLTAANTAAYDNSTGVITFSVAANTIFKSGDVITVLNGANVLKLQVEHIDSGNPTLVMCAMCTGSAADFAATALSTLRLTRTRQDVSEQVGAYEHVWQPPLSIFRDYDGCLPASDCELVLTPENSSTYKKRVIESYSDKTPGSAGSYDYEIVDMFFYLATIQADEPEPENMTFYLPIDNIDLLLEDLPTSGTSQNTKPFDVSPSTYAITVAVQDTAAGTTTDKSASKLVSAQSNKINRLYVDYAAQQLPDTEAQPSYKAGSAEDYMVQRYTENLLNTGAYFMDGGSETLEEWRERGAYHYIPFVKANDNGATRATAYVGFSEATPSSRLALFSHSKQLAECHVRNGQVVDVKVLTC